MFFKLLFLFITVPFIEVAILIKLATIIGFFPTIAITVVTAVVGAYLAKMEGLRVWLQIQDELAQGRVPTDKMIDGLMIFAGGIVLLTPGLLTDVFGLTLLFPVTRAFYKKIARKKFEKMQMQKQGDNIIIIK